SPSRSARGGPSGRSDHRGACPSRGRNPGRSAWPCCCASRAARSRTGGKRATDRDRDSPCGRQRRGMNAPSPSTLWIRRFLEAIAAERNATQNTLAAYARDLADYAEFLAGRGRDVAGADRGDIEAFMQDLALRGLA